MTIDSHHHFWNYDPVEFDWIDDSMRTIRRSFLPDDLKAEADHAGIDGVISVQARQILEETDFLLEQANANDFIKGVVGWVPLADANISVVLERYSDASKLKAVRHVVQGEAAGFLDGADFNHGIEQLAAHDLVYDVLIFEHQLKEAIRFVDRHPNQAFVLDHIAKPQIKNDRLEPWQKNLRELAKRDNITCKLSGVVTEADCQNWTPEQIRPYLDTVLGAFGPERLMFGSDWPVCLVACGYKRWHDLIREYIVPLSSTEQAAIMGGTATKAYNLKR
ncbi:MULTISPECIES: amidohydrolase [unclassified Lentimonas]|uniref:amidohydrolase family protein n=1 Tax=unclassified Lentimonas TaxID=2630993 RepID=UPI00132C441A|nr:MULTISPECIES: amidohydrolase family protein [unclassified Lentimonas]CAA6692727.1 L-fuconolactone hydrolase [Lentimonas sp. CC10]CAA6696707.1 L-fuconolactone hydrolase [Lentimonas sp. CC19]CAA7072313.1 L-fuconolactone hydrolase [Lentimonas sp. CC11]